MKFPVEMKDIEIFEKNNNISIHIFGWNGRIFTHRKPKNKKENHIYLLMLTENNKNNFCLVKSFSRLLRNGTQRKTKRFYCDNCLNWRSTQELLQKHQEFCLKQKPCETFPPQKSSIMKFRNFKNQTSMPFRIYADSEAILKPCEDQGHGEFQKHISCGFCFFAVAESGQKIKPILTKGENCVDEFLDKLIEHVQFLQNLPEKPLVMTKEDEEKFQKSKGCWFCGEEIKDVKVRDHCHFAGKFRGAAHQNCNLQARKPKFTPVFFHNLFGYDIHHFVTAISRKKRRVKCIPNNEEKYVSFSIFVPVEKEGKKIS